jgi:hypothetical protein
MPLYSAASDGLPAGRSMCPHRKHSNVWFFRSSRKPATTIMFILQVGQSVSLGEPVGLLAIHGLAELSLIEQCGFSLQISFNPIFSDVFQDCLVGLQCLLVAIDRFLRDISPGAAGLAFT